VLSRGLRVFDACLYLATTVGSDTARRSISLSRPVGPAIQKHVCQHCKCSVIFEASPRYDVDRLHLETLGPSSTTGLLELASLALDVWLLVLVGAHAEVLDSLSGVLWSSQQNNVAASWGSHGQLVESQALTAGLLDSGTGSRGESQSSDGQLGDDVHSVVVGDCADDCDGLALVGLLGGWGADFAVNAGEGHGWAVDSRHEQSLEDDLVEVGIGSSCASSVLLVLGLWSVWYSRARNL